MGGGEGLPGDNVSCQEMAEMEGKKRLHLIARKLQKLGEGRGSRKRSLATKKWQKWRKGSGCRELQEIGRNGG